MRPFPLDNRTFCGIRISFSEMSAASQQWPAGDAAIHMRGFEMLKVGETPTVHDSLPSGSASPMTGTAKLDWGPEIESALSQAVCSWQKTAGLLADRRWHRVPYDKPVALTPRDPENRQQPGSIPARDGWLVPTLRVTGRDLSRGGFSFVHLGTLPFRHVVATFGQNPDDHVSFLVKLNWCRFTRAGIYHSGGSFVRPWPTAVQLPLVLDDLPHA